jgi:EAL domain-containing protein (putative c-di-GMP-specific phosphodiesterase class I)
MAHQDDLSLIFEPGGLRVFFQPIFDTSGGAVRIDALECLCRGPKGSAVERSDALFRYVRTMKQESGVDRHCVLSAFQEAALLPRQVQMNINVHATTILNDSDLVNFISWSARAHEIETSRVVVEIVQHGPSTSEGRFRKRIEDLRGIGLRIALDDLGGGPLSYRTILDCSPDYLKVDRYLVAGADRDRSRRAALQSIAALAGGLGSRVIAEGVETGPELTAVREAGIDLIQGFLLAPPREGAAVDFETPSMKDEG